MILLLLRKNDPEEDLLLLRKMIQWNPDSQYSIQDRKLFYYYSRTFDPMSPGMESYYTTDFLALQNPRINIMEQKTLTFRSGGRALRKAVGPLGAFEITKLAKRILVKQHFHDSGRKSDFLEFLCKEHYV